MIDKFPLDHVGIAVKDLKQSIQKYQDDFGFTLELEEDVPSQKVKVAFIRLANTCIELLQPTDVESLTAKFIAKSGEGLHHMCFQVSDIIKTLSELKHKGYVAIDETPRSGSRHTQIAFLHPKSTGGVLIELCQYP